MSKNLTYFGVIWISLFWVLVFYFTVNNYLMNEAVKSEKGLVSKRISPIYSDALYFLANDYEVNKQGKLDAEIERLYSEVAYRRPLSPSSWISLANWSASHGFYENTAVYLYSSLLLLRNKPAAAWDLFDLVVFMEDRDLALNIASSYLWHAPRQFNEVVTKIEQEDFLDDDFLFDVIVDSIDGVDQDIVAEYISTYVIESILDENELVEYLFEFIELNEIGLTGNALNYLRNYLIDSRNYSFLRRNELLLSPTWDPLLSFSEDDLNADGKLCWKINDVPAEFDWSISETEDSLYLEFLGNSNFSFDHVSCGFFIPNDLEEIEEEATLGFSITGDKVTTSSGVYAEIYQPSLGTIAKSEAKTGTWNKESIELQFSTSNIDEPFYFKLRRIKTKDLDNLFSGEVEVSDISLSY